MTNAKRNAKTNATPIEIASIPLKTIHNDIMRDNANATIDTKRMRVWLRANMNDVHERNASWSFTQSQYDVVRSQFDATYRATIERRAKRNAKNPDAPKRARKSRVVVDVVTNNDDVVINNELQNANAE